MPGITDILNLGAAAEQARAICVFVHGRNQSPEEMRASVITHLSVPGVAYALPRAGDKCWYSALAVDPLTDASRADLAASLADLAKLIRDLRARAPGRPLLLAGFSQGACLSLEHGFAGADAPEAVAALTGCRVGVPGDVRAVAMPAGLPLYLTAGSDDPWIPLQAFAQACVEAGRAGAHLRADVFPARAHEVSAAEIAMLSGMLTDLAAGHRPAMGAAR